MGHDIVGEVWLGAALGWVPVPLRAAAGGGGVKITRSRKAGAALPDPGKCAVSIDNRSGSWSPRNPRGPYWGLLGRNTPFRLTVDGVRRFHGEVPSWAPDWSLSERDRWVPIEAAGILRRLLATNLPARSPMRRAYLATNPLAYWPLEDGGESTVLASALPDQAPMTVAGPFTIPAAADWSTIDQAASIGTDRLVDVAGGAALSGAVPATATAATAAGFTAVVTSEAFTWVGDGAPVDQVLLEVETPGGTFTRWQIFSPTTARTQVRAFTAAGAMTLVIDAPGVSSSLIDRWFSVWQTGPTITVGYGYVNPLGYDFTGTVAGTLTGVTRMSVNPPRQINTEPWPVGHVALWAGHNLPHHDYTTGDLPWSVFGFASVYAVGREVPERAVDRLARLCAEEGVPLTIIGDDPAELDQAGFMGQQASATFAQLVDECVTLDGGLLYEARDALGLVYRPRIGLYNRAPAVTLSYRAGHVGAPFKPVDDDDGLANDVTVERVNGSSYRMVDTTSRLSVLPPPAGVGRYPGPETPTLALATDEQLPAHAGWRLYLGTVDEPRYESITANLAGSAFRAAPALAAATLAVDHGDLVAVDDLPDWLPPGPVVAIVYGTEESVDSVARSVTWTGGPGSVWTVAEVDGDARVPAEGSTLAGALTGTAPAVTVWDFTSSSGVLGWSALNGAVAINGGALRFTPNGTSSSVELRSALMPAAAGVTYAGTATATCAVSRTVTPFLFWRNEAGSLLSSSSGPPVPTAAGLPAAYFVSAVAPAGATQVQLALSMGLTPPASNTLTVDVAQLAEQQTFQPASTAVNGVWTTDPADFPLDILIGGERVTVSAITGTGPTQVATITARGVNGVVRAWPAGTPVDVWVPAVAPL